jgi:hypothetical protein
MLVFRGWRFCDEAVEEWEDGSLRVKIWRDAFATKVRRCCNTISVLHVWRQTSSGVGKCRFGNSGVSRKRTGDEPLNERDEVSGLCVWWLCLAISDAFAAVGIDVSIRTLGFILVVPGVFASMSFG